MSKVLIFGGIAVLAVVVISAAGFYFMSSKSASNKVATNPIAVPAIPNQNTPQPAEQLAAPVNQIKLVVLTPVDKTVVATPSVKVTGQTVPNADVAINEVDTKSDSAGNFSGTISLSEGDNPIIVDVFDAGGNTSEQQITVTYQPAS